MSNGIFASLFVLSGNCNCICFRPGQVPLSVSTSRLYQLARNQKLMANRRDFCESIVYGNTIVCTWIPGTCRNIHTALSSMRGIVFYLPITKPQVALNLREKKTKFNSPRISVSVHSSSVVNFPCPVLYVW